MNLGGGAGNRTRVRRASCSPSFTCVAVMTPSAGFADSAATYPSLISTTLSRAPSRGPALWSTPAGYQDDLSLGRLYGFLGRESERVVVRTYDVPLGRRSRSRQHADEPFVPTSKPIAPVGDARQHTPRDL